MPTRSTRLLTGTDLEQSLRLGREAFGSPPPGTTPPSPGDYPAPGRHPHGTFEDGRLLARVVAHEYTSWFRGVPVPTSGIAGVTVVAEHRGAGLLHDLFDAVLAEARGRGEVVSTLFPTAPGIYRRFGYEVVGSYDTVDVPTAELALVPPAAGVRIRRADVGDRSAVEAVHDAWASRQNGPLTRRGPLFDVPDEEWLGECTGITLAEDEAGRVVGYAAWDRGRGYGPEGRLDVWDLVGLTPDAHRALWRVLGSFASVTPTTRLRTSGADLAAAVLPVATWSPVQRQPYMLRVDDVPGAFAALPLAGAAEVDLAVAGDLLGVLDGGYHLSVGGGTATCTRTDVPPGASVLTPRGLALLWSGAQSCGNLRMAGHLTGGSDTDDALLDALLGGRQVHVRDYF